MQTEPHFPFKIKTKNKKMPLLIVASAVLFNGEWFSQRIFYWLHILSSSMESTTCDYRCFGLFIGMGINRWADQKLISLREKEQGYQIPKGGLFEYISCPNHFGEILNGVVLRLWLGVSLPLLLRFGPFVT